MFCKDLLFSDGYNYPPSDDDPMDANVLTYMTKVIAKKYLNVYGEQYTNEDFDDNDRRKELFLLSLIPVSKRLPSHNNQRVIFGLKDGRYFSGIFCEHCKGLWYFITTVKFDDSRSFDMSYGKDDAIRWIPTD